MASTDSYAVQFRKGIICAPFAPSGVPLTSTVPLATHNSRRKPGRWWDAPVQDAAQVVRWADLQGVPVRDDVREYGAGRWLQESEAAALSSASALPEGLSPLPVTGLRTSLLPAQEVVVYAATHLAQTRVPGDGPGYRALLVADDPGLGKTIEALATLRVTGHEAQRAVIICPTNLIPNWIAEMGMHFEPGTFTPWTASGRTPTEEVPADADTLIIGWDVVGYWTNFITAWKPDAVFTDEGHYGKSGKEKVRKISETVPARDADEKIIRDSFGNKKMTKVERTVKVSGSKRGSAFIEIGADVASRGGLVGALTATPVLSRPAELEALLEYIGVIEQFFLSGKAFRDRYCDPRTVGTGSQTRTLYLGHSNIQELHQRLMTSGHYIRRTKRLLVQQGLLKPKYVDGVYAYDLKTRPSPWIIRPTETEMSDYRVAQRELEDFFARRTDEIRGRGSEAAVRKKMISEGRQHLKRILALRRVAAMTKVPYIVNKVREVVAQGEKVVIVATHRDIVDAYAAKFSGLKIQGGMSSKKVEEVKALFNGTPVTEHPVLALSIDAGKTGHTLCKQAMNGVGKSCAFMTLAEQVWTPGDEIQVQDRIWRIGQEREVRIINALLADSIDIQMYERRRVKRDVVDSVLNGSPETRSPGGEGAVSESRAAGLLAWDLARAGLARR